MSDSVKEKSHAVTQRVGQGVTTALHGLEIARNGLRDASASSNPAVRAVVETASADVEVLVQRITAAKALLK